MASARASAAATVTPGIEKRGLRYYAVRDVPRSLHSRMGKKRLVQSLKTKDLSVAKARSYLVQAVFQSQIEDAQRVAGPSVAVEVGLSWKATFEALKRGDKGLIARYGQEGQHVLNEHGRREELSVEEAADVNLSEACSEELDLLATSHGGEEAALARGIANGTATPLRLFVDAWLAEGGPKGTLTPRTKAQYRSDLTALETWMGTAGFFTIEQVTKRLAGRYVSDALLGTGMNRVTANRKISAPSAYWRWLEKRGHVEGGNPWTGQSLSKGSGREAEEDKKRAFTTAEMKLLLSGKKLAADVELADAIRVGALSGMRLEEVYRLEVRDTANDEFNIRTAKTPAGKRRVPVHSDLVELVARRVAGKAPGEFLFHEAGPAEPGRQRSAALSKRFGHYRQSVGVHEKAADKRHSSVDYHSLRRWWVTSARNAGIDTAVVASVVGHAAQGITDGVYHSGPSEALRRAAVEAVKLPT